MRSLYMRVLIISVYTIGLCGLFGFYIANVYQHFAQKPAQDAKLFRIAERMRFFMEQHPDVIADYLHNAASLGYQIYVYDEAGNDICYGSPFARLDLANEVKDGVLGGQEYHGVASWPYSPFMSGYFASRLSNTVGIPFTVDGERYALFVRQDANMQFDEMRVFVMTMLIASALLGIPFILLSTRYIVQPIVSLTEATKRIAQGDFRFRLPVHRKDEIGQLAAHFAKMSKQLERSAQMKKEFVANVSHEILSPLSSIQAYAGELVREELDQERIRQYAAVIEREAEHLAALTRQLLLLSSLDHTEAVKKRELRLRPQIRHVLKLLEWQLMNKEITVRMRVPEEFRVWGDEVLLLQVWTNLLTNAIKHNSGGHSIEIEAAMEAGQSVVTIRDTGNGIPEERLPHLFEAFYTGDSARDRAAGSTGLGLSIVQKIVRLHGGQIEVSSEVGAGSEFSVRLPIQGSM